MSRLKTLSKHYYNDEIQGVLPNGDIILKEGVHRLKYENHLEESLDSQLNQELLKIDTFFKIKEKLGLDEEL